MATARMAARAHPAVPATSSAASGRFKELSRGVRQWQARAEAFMMKNEAKDIRQAGVGEEAREACGGGGGGGHSVSVPSLQYSNLQDMSNVGTLQRFYARYGI